MDVWPDMRQAIRALRPGDGAHRPLWLTGHSLGGALATIAASLLVDDDESFFGVYTFGSPRSGVEMPIQGWAHSGCDGSGILGNSSDHQITSWRGRGVRCITIPDRHNGACWRQRERNGR